MFRKYVNMLRINFLLKNNPAFILLILVLVVFIFFFPNKIRLFDQRQPWIKAIANSLIRNGKPFNFVGANAVNMVFYDDWDLDIEKAIRTAKENNISVLRIYLNWGWGKNEDYDKIINIASRYGIYVVLTLTDCCCSCDFTPLERYFEVHAPFCNITNEQSKEAFKKSIKQIIQRKNLINGRIYRDDPTILAWEIANELEYWHFSETDVNKWVNEIANYIKALDSKHLVTIGINVSNSELINSGALYKIFNASGIDFFSFHFYPSPEISDDNKIKMRKEDIHKIEAVTKKFLSLGKPVIMGEFGFSNSIDLNAKIRSNRDTARIYNQVFKKYMDTAFISGCSGVMFWGWGIPEEKKVPMWWSKESHNIADEEFCSFLRNYRIFKNIDSKSGSL